MEEEIKSEDKRLSYKNSSKASILLVLSSCLTTLLLGIWNEKSGIELIKYTAYTVIIDFIILYYMNLYREKVMIKPYAWWMVVVGYMISIILLLPSAELSKYPFWMLGSVLIAYLVDVNLSFLVTYSLLFLSVVMRGQSVESAILQVILGTFMCILAKYLKKAFNLIYISIFISSMSLTLFFIKYNFSLDKVITLHSLYSIGSSLVVMLIAYFIGLYIHRVYAIAEPAHDNSDRTGEVDAYTAATINNTDNQDAIHSANDRASLANEKVKEEDRSLLEITKENHPLLEQLSQEAPKLYRHCKEVAELSKKAAKSVGANADLAYAGGWYHEIGRLEGKNYVECGEAMAKEYRFPKEVIEIIRQHNYKFELPRSEESAIVMLSDNIISTINYLKSTGQTGITKEKVIENTFTVRFNKGTLDESGITLQKFNRLKHFYMLELIFEE